MSGRWTLPAATSALSKARDWLAGAGRSRLLGKPYEPMAWVKLDDQFYSHPKVRRARKADLAALGLHMVALSYCGAHLTDGAVDDLFVEEIVPNPAKRRRMVGVLIETGLWERNGSGWLIHDYLDFNESRKQVIERRRRDAERKRVRS